MKKAEAISILATSVRPREAKDRARYDEAVKMAIEALKCSETPKSSERTSETAQPDHTADVSKKVERTDETVQNVSDSGVSILIKGMDEIPEDKSVLVVRHDNGKAYIKYAYTFGYSMELVKLPAVQPEPHWIPCSERLPGKNCRCLTTNEAWGSFEVDWNVWIDGKWLYPNEKPIAWMPLPEPYRGGGAE